MYLDILDVHSILHSAQHVNSLSKERIRGCPVGGIKLLVKKIAYLLSNGNHVVCAFDSKTDRRIIMPEYKSNRKSVPEVRLQAELAYKILSDSGISCIKIDNLEADDIVYNVVERYRPVCFDINIHTSDMDLAHNIVNARTKIYSVNSNSYNVTYDNFIDVFSEVDFTVPHNLVTAKKIFMGDSSDDILSFTSYDGRTGKELFKKFVDMTFDYKIYDPIVNRTKEFFDILIGEMNFTAEDLNTLEKRAQIFYPRKTEEFLLEPSNLDNIDGNYFKSTLKSLKSFEGLRSLPYSGESNPLVDEQLFSYGNSFRSGEFHVDRNISIEEDPYNLEDSSIFIRDL